MIGSRLSHFEITSKIGEGGMGEVYQATDTKLNREVALKILPETFSQDAERMARFSREAQLLASLNHPNIASIYGLEETNGTRALVMELVKGEDLSERLARGPIPLEEALPIALQIAEALEDAHEKGIIHRDLKPANVRITPAGKVKILDFGLAKALEEERTSEEVSNSPTLTMAATQAGYILGTAAYMSPEQARGKSVDRRADIWAFGVVLFEMLAGGKVFRGEDISLTLASVMKEEPDWEQLPQETPSSIRRLLKGCLRKDVRRRIQHIGDARIAIEDYRADPEAEEPDQIVSSAPATSGRQRLLLGVAFLVVLLLGVLLSWMLRPEPLLPGPVRLKADIAGDKGLSTNWGNCAAISPDGRLLVYRAGAWGDPLRLRWLDRLTTEDLQGTEHAFAPFFSPDGRWIGFSDYTSQTLKKVSLSGGTPATLCSIPDDSVGGTWGPNGVIVFATGARSLMQVSAAGGIPGRLTELEQGETGHSWPLFLPGGKHVLFTSHTADTQRIEVVNVVSKKRSLVLEAGGDYPRYAASGHLLYVENSTLFAVSFDLGQLQTTSEPLPVVEDVMMDSFTSGAAQYGVSSDGTLFYMTAQGGRRADLRWVDAEGRQTAASRTPRDYRSFPDLSPDGKRLAVGITSNNNGDLWVIDLARDAQMRLTFDEADDTNPIWSPDGRFLYFSSSRDGKPGIFRKAADGSGEAERILESDTIVPVRAASDEYLVLAKELDLYLFSLLEEGVPGPEPLLVNPNSEEGSPRFSPNGHWLAYDSNETGRYEVYLQPFPGLEGRWQVSAEGGFRPQWSADGGKLFYRTDDAIWVSEVETQGGTVRLSPSERLVKLEGRYDQDLGVDSDGDRFLLISLDGQVEGRNQLTFVFNWFEELRQLTEDRQ